MGSWGEMLEREGLQRAGRGASATMKDGRRLRQAGMGSWAGTAGESVGVGNLQGARDGVQLASLARRMLAAPAGATLARGYSRYTAG